MYVYVFLLPHTYRKPGPVRRSPRPHVARGVLPAHAPRRQRQPDGPAGAVGAPDQHRGGRPGLNRVPARRQEGYKTRVTKIIIHNTQCLRVTDILPAS